MTLDFENTKIGSENNAEAETSAAANSSAGNSNLLAPVGMEALIPDYPELALGLVRAKYFSREAVHQHLMKKFKTKYEHARNIVAKIMLHGNSIIHKRTGERLTYSTELAEMAQLEFEVAYKNNLMH